MKKLLIATTLLILSFSLYSQKEIKIDSRLLPVSFDKVATVKKEITTEWEEVLPLWTDPIEVEKEDWLYTNALIGRLRSPIKIQLKYKQLKYNNRTGKAYIRYKTITINKKENNEKVTYFIVTTDNPK